MKTLSLSICAVLAFAVHFSASFNGSGLKLSGDPAKPAPTPVKKLKPEALKKRYDESAKICNGNQLKPQLTNPTCEGWWLASITEAPNQPDEGPFYLGDYRDECAIGVNGQLKCFFKKAKRACEAWAAARNNDTVFTSGMRPFCGCGELAQNSTTIYNCSFCESGQMGCSGGAFINSLKCPAGKHDITLVPIQPGEYHGYCAIEVNGPYSNLYGLNNEPEHYTACGTEQTETYPGMIFVKDQRDKIKAVNRNANGGKIRSDLAGFCYPKGKSPCIKAHPTLKNFCVEPGEEPGEFLEGKEWLFERDSPQVHHVVPAKDRRGCPCGKNSVKNAAVISAQLNNYFRNYDRTSFHFNCRNGLNEIQTVNGLRKYPPYVP